MSDDRRRKMYPLGPNANGHEYVDLGLPSGTLWATMNVGASSPYNAGGYYKYGYGSVEYTADTNYYTGMEDPLDLSLDTAHCVWGGSWHMPTNEQCLELIDLCSVSCTTYNNRYVFIFTKNNQSLIFPVVGVMNTNLTFDNRQGYYRTSTPGGNDYYAKFLHFSIPTSPYYNTVTEVIEGMRYVGYSVRGVLG